jgi:hypothetical protein
MTEPAAPAPTTAPAATRNPTTMLLALLGAALLIAGAFLAWLPGDDAAGINAPVSLFWSTDYSEGPVGVSFITSAGFVILIIGLITLIGAVSGRNVYVQLGGLLGLIAFALIVISFMRVQVVEIGFGDYGLGVWAIGLGAVLAIAAGMMGRRTTV